MGCEVFAENLTEDFFGAARGRAVVVGEVEVGDAVIERVVHNLALAREVCFGTFTNVVFEAAFEAFASKVVPEPEGDRRQQEPRSAEPPEMRVAFFIHGCAVGGGALVHGGLLAERCL